jgi:D-sedoheptulose 7-phosphate isomerase
VKQTAIKHLDNMLARYPQLAAMRDLIIQASEMICACHRSGGKVLVCGNGGSAADSEHIVGELMKGFVLRREPTASDIDLLRKAGCEDLAGCLQRGIQAIALTGHPSLSTAIQNDIEPFACFAQQVYVCGRPGDVLIGLSTSGKARNVVNAVRVARALDLPTIGLTGSAASPMDELCDLTIKVPSLETFRAQELHMPVYHAICLMVEEEIFG